jgi:hypothetical protein
VNCATGTGTGSSFGDILKESKGDQEDQGDKVQMTEQDGTSLFPLIIFPIPSASATRVELG